MKQLLIFIFCFSTVTASWSQSVKLNVKNVNLKPFVEHKIQDNQTIFTLSRMYNISLSEIADANNELYKKGFSNGDIVYIPITKSNYISEQQENALPLEYEVNHNETLIILAKWMNVRQSMLQTWNDLPTPNVRNGQKVILGWLKYTPQNNPKASALRDNKILDEPLQLQPNDEFQQIYESIDADEMQENGSVIFYTLKTNLKPGVYHAFHNNIPIGSIIKVTNPLNQNTIYAKIISTMPKLNEYNNAKLVLSDNAIKALNAESKSFFCNIFYK